MRMFWIALLAICASPANADDYTLTLALISGNSTLTWHEAALETQGPQPFGEGCMFMVDRPFVQDIADIASAGVTEKLDPNLPFSVAEMVVFQNDEPVLIFGGWSDVRSPGVFGFRLDEDAYNNVWEKVHTRAKANSCFEKN